MPKVLVADDDETVLRLTARLLHKNGHETTEASDAVAALNALHKQHFDVVVSDVMMPNLTGIDLLREVRRHDLDVPVVLMTGAPELNGAIAAVELGAFRYLPKPFEAAELLSTVDRAARLHRLARLKRAALELVGADEHLLGDRASLEERFAAAMASLWVAFQPIVSTRERRVVAYEALLRTEEASLRNPAAFITAAERLGELRRLGRSVRAHVAIAAANTTGADFFVNLHPTDLNDPELCAPSSPLCEVGARIVLEVTERTSLEHIDDISARVKLLRRRGFRIAVDDLGAGYAGLSSLTTLEPEVVKLDMSLVRNIDTDPIRQRVVASLIELCDELSMRMVLEGIETPGERDMLLSMGGDVMQGFHFARPGRPFPALDERCWTAA